MPVSKSEIFTQLYNLSDPIPGVDSHYKSFEELYDTQTIEKYRPSCKKTIFKTKFIQIRGSIKEKAKHIMPFVLLDKSDQENEINEIDDTCSNNSKEDMEDAISDPI
ncbi:31504_t:CDS:2 [Gigaspora margarita]|uniref:31504_t:CDS:1 n=1 Tax=Gigaspora margarita TaxID=4874 RepID=A0ABN7UC97_GIGMA|nr:31504_t:CDS:2 [Gigaspora margarita]